MLFFFLFFWSLLVLCAHITLSLYPSRVQNYCVQGLELFASYLFKDILELYDWNLTGTIPKTKGPFSQKEIFTMSADRQMAASHFTNDL